MTHPNEFNLVRLNDEGTMHLPTHALLILRVEALGDRDKGDALAFQVLRQKAALPITEEPTP